jgi:hypothetical protein
MNGGDKEIVIFEKAQEYEINQDREDQVNPSPIKKVKFPKQIIH